MPYILQDLLTDALLEINKISVYDTINAKQAEIGMRRANLWLDSQNADLMKVWQEVPNVFPLSSQQSYAMGADQTLPNFQMQRPSKITKVNLLLNNNSGVSPTRTPIKMLNYQQWGALSVPNVPAGYPVYCYWDNADLLSAPSTVTAGLFLPSSTYTIVSVGTTNFMAIGAASNTVGVVFVATGIGSGTGTALSTGGVPYSNISFWTDPGQNQSVEIWCWNQAQQFTALNNVITYPNGWARFVLLGMSIELAPAFGCEPSPTTMKNFWKAEQLVNGLNAPSPLAACAAGYPGNTNTSNFNIYSGDDGAGSWPPSS
jgi:hypothetical protein